MIDISLIY